MIRRRTIAIIASFALGFVGSMAVALHRGIPAPQIHDEFSYLLAADTFASGRLTNPPHPHWTFFESFHIIHQPTYMSKYPPGQGLLLALGQASGIGPIGGVWLGMGLMGAALCWMLASVMPARWAILGTTLALLQFGVFDYWAQSYWGGALAATGGAMVLGGVIRLLRRPNGATAALTAAGALVLSVSRPFEGLILCLTPCILIFHRLTALKYRDQRPQWIRALAPAIIVLFLGGIGHGVYNKSVTGSIAKMPYMAHSEQYLVTPLFLWNRPLAAPEYRHERLAQFAKGWELDCYLTQRSVTGVLLTKFRSFAMLFTFFISAPLAVPAVLGMIVLIRKKLNFVLIAVVMTAAMMMTTTWVFAHYAAVIASAIALCFGLGVRWIVRQLKLNSILALLLVAILTTIVTINSYMTLASNNVPGWSLAAHRESVLRKLDHAAGDDLVFVRYDNEYTVLVEWVYNSANIDQQKVIWARDCGDEANEALIQYYRHRRVWILEALDPTKEPKLIEYISLTKIH